MASRAWLGAGLEQALCRNPLAVSQMQLGALFPEEQPAAFQSATAEGELGEVVHPTEEGLSAWFQG